jgi:uncharacterized protein YjlB
VRIYRRSLTVRAPAPQSFILEPNGEFPNSPLPVLLYCGVAEAREADRCERRFAACGWVGAWRGGIYPFHHFHSTAHEVLGIVAGSVSVMLGGPGGRRLELAAGDVVMLPAGTGHCNLGASRDLLVVGAYPRGTSWDLRRGDPAEREQVLANLRAVPLPDADPLSGADGLLPELWGRASGAR